MGIFDIGYYVVSGEENKVLKIIMCISSLWEYKTYSYLICFYFYNAFFRQNVLSKILIVILLKCKFAHSVRFIHLLPCGKLVNKDLFEQSSILSRNSMFIIRDSRVLFNGANADKLS